MEAKKEIEDLVRLGFERASGIDQTLVKLKAVNISPVIQGGPRGKTVEDGRWVGLRPTSLRGVWRWWIRSLLSALLWEKGFNLNYADISKLEIKIGLGSVMEDEKRTLRPSASDVYLEVKVNSTVKEGPLQLDKFFLPGEFIVIRKRKGRQKLEPDFWRILRHYLNECSDPAEYETAPWKFLLAVPRYRLLTTGLEPCIRKRGTEPCLEEVLFERQPIPPGRLEVEVAIKSRRGRMSEFAPLYRAALLLALSVGGLGQAVSRGFGRFGVETIEIGPPELKSLGPGELNPERIIETLRPLQGRLIELAERLALRRKGSSGGIPYIPTYHPEVCRFEILDVRIPATAGRAGNSREARHVWDVLVAAGHATLKVSWKKLMGDSWKRSGGDLHTWPLGLPRGKKGRTGYAFEVGGELEPRRLASLIRIGPVGGGRAIVYGFRTQDLVEAVKRGLLHLSGRGRGTPVSKLEVTYPTGEPEGPVDFSPQNVFEAAFRAVSELISSGGWL